MESVPFSDIARYYTGASVVARSCQLVLEALLSALLLSTAGAAPRPEKPAFPRLRWTEGLPGCTFSADDDGRYRYGLWTSDFGIVLAVDSQDSKKPAAGPNRLSL